MELIISATSPYVRKVRVLVREGRLLDRVQEIEVVTTAFAPDPVAISANPLGKIPALIRDNGSPMYDSRSITRFLDDLAGGGFYPAAPALWDVLTWEATADGIMDCAVSMAYEIRLRDPAERSERWIEAQWSKCEAALDVLAQSAAQSAELWRTEALHLGHIGTACMLSFLDFRHGDRQWRTGREPLADWHAVFEKRPSMVDTAPPPQ
ncbi:MAG: glutathione S-transferase family protein [Pseudomonadota bacterium]